MIPDIIELNFPKKEGKQYATLTQATANIADMGEKTITTQVKIDGEIVPDFSYDWEVEFQGEKYIMPLRIPQGAKENTSLNSTIDLTFQHWAIYQLKRWPFVTIQQIAAGTYLPDEEEATVQLNLKDLCILFGQVLEYYYGGAITIDLNPAWQYKQEATIITISHTKIWNVLIDAFHDKYGVRWEIKAAADNSNTVKGGERYVIRVGYPTTEVDHIFEYGFEGGLLKVERQVQSEEIRNMLKGRGGDTNIPFRYFKNTDPNNEDFRPDPDWVEELANIYFPNLMPATFRSYVQGWKAAHISKYPGYTAVGESNAYAPWAYRKGYTDTKFAPVEFVADEITINPATGDKQVEILPGYSPYVKKGSSLDKYGPLPDTLDNNDDVYPTLQGTGLDIAVAVEQIQSDDVEESVDSDAKVVDLSLYSRSKTEILGPNERKRVVLTSLSFPVEEGTYADLYEGEKTFKVYKDAYLYGFVRDIKDWRDAIVTYPVAVGSDVIEVENAVVYVVNALTGEERSASGIPGGHMYNFVLRLDLHNTSNRKLSVTFSCESPKLVTASLNENKWKNVFNIWAKDIWGIERQQTETDAQYAERVWKPVLGDREGNEGKVVFTSGALAHEDYEFTIVDFPVPDTSKIWEEKDDNGVVIATHTSHWRITLAKSDAELEATGLYVPSTKKQGKAGDTFVFVNTEMTHVPYVVDAEIRLDDWKKDHLGEVKEIKPTCVVTTDRVRLNNEGKPNALINQLRVGNSLRLFDKRFFNEEGKAYETLYLQSITYTYREPTSDDAALNPDVEIVLGNEYTTSANPVSMMQGEISALQKQVGSISNVEQIVRAVGDRLYLRKDGISDRSLSPTQFFSLLTSGDFRHGIVGGSGWGFFKDENDNWVLEADRVNVRQEMQVNTLVINQAEGRGGMEIDTAAFITVLSVADTSDGYICYFDQKDGSIANLFHVDDVAYCNRWTPENTELKFYKRRVVEVGVDYITLTKECNGADRPEDWPDSGVNGTGIPAEKDNIIHFGNYTDKTRQYVKVRDVIGGGYERYIEELNSVNAAGVEYYYVGRMDGQQPRWFIGNKDLIPYSGKGDGSYIEYKDRKFHLNNVSLSIGNKPLDQYIEDTAKEETAEMIKDTDILFIAHTSQTVAPVLPLLAADGTIAQLNGWTTDAPAAQAGLYIWQTTYVLRGDGTASFVGTACVTGRDGSSYAENLLTGTRDFTGGWDYLDRGTVTSDTYKGCRVFETTRQWGGTNRPVHLEPGTYTFSAYARVSSQEQVNIYLNAAQNTQPVIGTDWQRIRFVFRVDTAGTYNPRIEKHLATSTVLYTAGWKVEEGDNPNPVWSPAPAEQVGQSAKTVIVNSDATAFMYEDNFNKLTGPNTINLTATLQGTTGYQWSYKTPSMAAFVDMQGMTSATYSLTPTASGWGSDKSMTLRCTSGGVHDEVTIAKVSSGAKGSGYTHNLLLNTAFTNGFDKWYNWGTPTTREVVTENGKNWFHLVANADSMYQGLAQDTRLDVVNGAAYTFSALVRGSAPNQQFTFGVQYVDANNTIVAQTWQHWRIGTTPQRVERVFGINNNPASLHVMIGRGDKEVSDIYITDVKLEKGENHATVWSPAASEMLGTPGANYTENLVTGSRSGIGWIGYTRLNDGVFEKDNSSTTEKYIFAPDITVEAGKKYTLSFQAKATANLRNADLFLIGEPGFTQNSFSPTTQWQSFSFVNTSPQSRSGAPRFDNNASTDGTTATLYIKDFKIEEGENPNPAWTPNSSEMVGTDAYTVLLTNESHTFAGDSEKAVASSTDCGIVAYKGATQVAATIGAISGMPSGMTAAVSGNGTLSAKFTVSVTTALTQRQGTLSVPVTVDGKTFDKVFSWSLSLDGVDATFSPNLVPSIIYDPNLKGGGSTNAMKWIGLVWGNSELNNLRIDLIGKPIKEAGWYSVYFMARRVSGAGAVSVDINDCGITVTPDLSTIDGDWRAFSGKVYVYEHIGVHGFIDFMNGDGIELSDITVTKGEAVPASWLPTAPELTGGSDNLLLRSDVEVSNAGYPIASYRIAETLNNNETLTCTIWGELKGGANAWGVYNSSGNYFLKDLYRVADGVYSAAVRWVTNTDTNNDTLVVYPMDRTDATAVSTIRCIKLERGLAATPWSRSSHDFDFITAALKQNTEIDGGLILSALMKLGVKDASGVRRIMAGINGLVNSSDDLALWAGGDMVDADKFPNDPDRAAAAIRHNGTAYFARNVIRMLGDYVMVGDNVRLDKDGLKLMVDGDTSLEITNRDVYTDFNKLASNKTRFSYNARIGPSIGVESGNSVIVEETYDAVSLGEIEAGTQVVVNIALEGVQDSRNFGNGSVNSPFNQPLTVIAYCGSTAVHQTTMPVHSMTVTHNDAYGRPSWSEHTYRIIGTTTFTASKTGTYEIEITFLKESSAAMLGWFSLEGTMSGTVKLALSNQMTIGRNGLSVIRNNNALAINDSMVVMRSGSFGFALHPTLGPVITLNSGTNWYAAQLSGSQIVFNKRVTL